jgi:hypothetical protein
MLLLNMIFNVDGISLSSVCFVAIITRLTLHPNIFLLGLSVDKCQVVVK